MISLWKPWFPGLDRSEVVMKFTQIYVCMYNIYIIWLFNIAMENHHAYSFLIGKPSINVPFSMAMLHNQRVYIYIFNIFWGFPTRQGFPPSHVLHQGFPRSYPRLFRFSTCFPPFSRCKLRFNQGTEVLHARHLLHRLHRQRFQGRHLCWFHANVWNS